MSYQSITLAARDDELAARVAAAVHKEARVNATLAATPFAGKVRLGMADIAGSFAYPVAIATEAAYESALVAENPSPGSDPGVITDAAILSAVQANWPDT